MDNHWLDICTAQRLAVLEPPVNAERCSETGYVLLRDKRGTVLPLGSFEVCDQTRGITIFPAQTLNTLEKDNTLAAAMGIARLWEGKGVLTFRFANRIDSPDFAVLSVTEGETPAAVQLSELRGFRLDALLSRIDSEEDVLSSVGPLTGLTGISALADGVLYTDFSVQSVLSRIPELSGDTLAPWFRDIIRVSDAG